MHFFFYSLGANLITSCVVNYFLFMGNEKVHESVKSAKESTKKVKIDRLIMH